MARDRNLYLITSGDDYERSSHAVIRGKAAAERLLARLVNTPQSIDGRGYEIEPFMEVAEDVEQVTTYRINTEIWDNGATATSDLGPWVEWPFSMLQPDQNVPSGWRWVRAPCHQGEGGRLEVYGTDLGAVHDLSTRMTAYLLGGGHVRSVSEKRGTAVPEED